ncbi:MAG: 3-deoxy-manno-octulosonate cytidylyltransferase [Salinivirgaceae bacterium]|nr:3-deoxy-manno-octulosonate cytidylyltransferase [Salinivirgaceae bacterium]
MVIVGIIPARYASTRFPGKPLVDIKGKPMIQHVYEKANEALDLVCVATDDERIEKAVKNFGGNVVITNANHPSGSDRCAEAIRLFERQKNIVSDVVINIQGDEPFIDPAQIQQLANLFVIPTTQIATLIKSISDREILFNANKVKVVINKNGEAMYFSRSSIPFVRNEKEENWLSAAKFYHHIGMYGYRKEILFEICKLEKSSLENAESLEQLRWLENNYKISTAITHIEGFSIDTPEDLEELLKQL